MLSYDIDSLLMKDLKKDILSYSNRIYGVAINMLQNTADAQDCTQEVLFKLWTNKDKFSKHPNPAGYVFLITKNACFDFIKANKKIAAQEPKDFDLQTPEDNHIKESAELIKKMIEKLPEIPKQIIEQRDVLGFSFEEIAKELDLSITNVRVILSRTRKLIREELIKKHAYGLEEV